jgi:hypothetical protein
VRNTFFFSFVLERQKLHIEVPRGCTVGNIQVEKWDDGCCSSKRRGPLAAGPMAGSPAPLPVRDGARGCNRVPARLRRCLMVGY